jgi:hypothetical protein
LNDAITVVVGFELGFAFDDPGIGGLFVIEGFCFAVDDDAAFLDDDLSGEGLEPSLRVRPTIVPIGVPVSS